MKITVIYHDDPDGVWAESPDLEGWTAMAGTLDELQALVEESVPDVLEEDGIDPAGLEIEHRQLESEVA